MPNHPSPVAAESLQMTIYEAGDTEDFEGFTDCPEGCEVEPDGVCPHGFESAALTLGVI